jgi:hypothetical protein
MQLVIPLFVVLVPIVPAYLLFRVLPSSGNVSGKLQGLEIKLGGAFAGYFAVVLLIFYHYDKLFPVPPPPSAFVWHLSGQIVKSSGEPIEPLDLKDFSFSPPWLQTMPGGNFRLTIPTSPQDGGGTEWPMLVIGHDGYAAIKVPLSAVDLNQQSASSLGLVKDDLHRSITMRRITLSDAQPYQPTGPQPQHVSGPKPKRPPLAAKRTNP